MCGIKKGKKESDIPLAKTCYWTLELVGINMPLDEKLAQIPKFRDHQFPTLESNVLQEMRAFSNFAFVLSLSQKHLYLPSFLFSKFASVLYCFLTQKVRPI